MKIYLAVPYSHPDASIREARFKAVNQASAYLMQYGHIVFSPISHSHPIAVQCGLPLDFDFWAKFDRSFIEWCDCFYVLKLEGWETSDGVRREMAIANELGKSPWFLRCEFNNP